MVATSSTLAASRCSSLTSVTLVPLTNSRKLSLGSRESVTLPIMTEMTAKGPGDRKGVGREPQRLSEVRWHLSPWAGLKALGLCYGQPPWWGKLKARKVIPSH